MQEKVLNLETGSFCRRSFRRRTFRRRRFDDGFFRRRFFRRPVFPTTVFTTTDYSTTVFPTTGTIRRPFFRRRGLFDDGFPTTANFPIFEPTATLQTANKKYLSSFSDDKHEGQLTLTRPLLTKLELVDVSDDGQFSNFPIYTGNGKIRRE